MAAGLDPEDGLRRDALQVPAAQRDRGDVPVLQEQRVRGRDERFGRAQLHCQALCRAAGLGVHELREAQGHEVERIGPAVGESGVQGQLAQPVAQGSGHARVPGRRGHDHPGDQHPQAAREPV